MSRKKIDELQPQTVILSLNGSTPITNFIDTLLVDNGRYCYFISAVDSSGNISKDSIIVEMITSRINRPQISNFLVSYNPNTGVKLTWDCQGKDVVQIEIARIVYSGGPINYALNWKFLDGMECDTIDNEAFAGTHQRKYGIQAVYSDGSRSMSKIIEIPISSP